MYRLLIPVAVVALSLALCAAAEPVAAANPSVDGGGKKLFHVVSVKFKEGAATERIGEAEKAFVALKEKIPGITSLHWGTNISPEHRNKGFTHCFMLTFASEADRDTYLGHAEHKAFGKVLGPVMDDVMVLDFWAE